MTRKMIAAAIVLGLTSAAASQAAVLSFQEGDLRLDGSPVGAGAGYATDATWIRGNSPGANLNGDGRLLAGSNYDSGPLRTVLQFDLAELATQAGPSPRIRDVQLIMRAQGGLKDNRTTVTLDAHRYDRDVDETTSTWNDPDAAGLDPTPGGTLGPVRASITVDPVASGVDEVFGGAGLVAAVSGALTGPSPKLRLIIKDRNETTSLSERSWSNWVRDESGTVESRPELLVQFTSPPIAADSFLTGSQPADGEYSTASLVPQNPTVSSFNAAWADGASTTQSGTFNVVGTSLTGTMALAQGGSVEYSHTASLANTQSAVRTFTNSLDPYDTLYFAGLMSLDGSFNTDSQSLALTGFLNAEEGQDPLTLGLQWGFQGDGSEVDAVIRARDDAGGNPVVFRTLAEDIAPGTHLFVGKVEVDYTGTSTDRVSMWFDPADVSSELAAGSPDFVEGMANITQPSVGARILDTLVFRTFDVGAGAVVGFDEPAFGTTWESVVQPIPEPSTLLVWGLFGLLGAGYWARRRAAV